MTLQSGMSTSLDQKYYEAVVPNGIAETLLIAHLPTRGPAAHISRPDSGS